MLRKLAVAIVTILASTQMASASCDGDEAVAKFSHQYSVQHPIGKAVRKLEDAINEKLDGRLCLVVFGGGSLYRSSEELRAITRGHIDMAAISISRFATHRLGSSAFNFFLQPFAFRNLGEVEKAWESDFAEFFADGYDKALSSRSNLRVAALLHIDLAHIASSRRISKPGDVDKIGVHWTHAFADAMDAAGKSVVQLAPGEALDTMEFLPLSERAKNSHIPNNITLTGHRYVGATVLVSDEFLESLPNDVRNDFLGVILDVSKTVNDETKQASEAALEDLRDARSSMVAVSGRERNSWLKFLVSCPDCSGGGQVCGKECPNDCKSGCTKKDKDRQCCSLSGMPPPPGWD